MLYTGYRMERKRRNWARLIGTILPVVFLLAHQLRQRQKRNAAPTGEKQHAYRPVVPQAGPTWVWWVFVAVIADGMRAGEIRRDIAPAFAYRMMMDVMGAVQRWYEPEKHTEDQVVGGWIDIFFRGISADS